MVQNREHHFSPGKARGWGGWRYAVYLFWGVCTAVTLSACLGGGDGEEQPVAAGQAVLTCNEMCAAQGQCGTAVDGRALVLGHSDRPQTRDHNLVFNVDLPVTVLEVREQTIQPMDNQPYVQPFSLVILNDNGQQGWVANWCVAQAPAQ